MVLWFAGLAFVAVVFVFRDAAMDYRLVMVGALLPDAVDIWLGGPRVLHTLLASVAVLLAVMAATLKRRAARRRLLALPIGMFLHLVLDGMWGRTHDFWWPAFGTSFSGDQLPSLERPLLVLIAQEIAGLVALLWCARRFQLTRRAERDTFVRTGRLRRDLVG